MERPPAPVRPSSLAERQLGRPVLAALVAATLAAVLGPLISYRSDVAELRLVLHTHVTREARLYAEALNRHLALMQAELQRLADRPEVDLLDGQNAPERELLSITHRDSALFAVGVALFDTDGNLLWSEPGQMPSLGTKVAGRGWFQRMLATKAPVADVLEGSERELAVSVPVLRSGRVTGAVVGVLDADQSPLPKGRAMEDAELAVLDDTGDTIFPFPTPDWARAPKLFERVQALLKRPGGGPLDPGDESRYASAALVGQTGLRLVLVASEDRLLAPMRGEVLLQLLLLSSVQIGAVLILGLFVRGTYRRYLLLERRAVQQDKLAALGGASLLIAHEVKNSLNGLNAAATLLSTGADPALPTRTLKGQVDRLRHLATSLLQFARPSVPQRVPTTLQPLVSQVVEGLKLLPEADDVAVEQELGPALETACDPLLLATALDNLVRNAIEAAAAAKDMGKIAEPRVRVTLERLGAQLKLAVADNAGGPPPGFEESSFEPFQTSKPKGIGLGLSMARHAIEQQGGTLVFERTADGSRFTIQLPIIEAP